MNSGRIYRLAILLTCLAWGTAAQAAGPTGLLNDTGQTRCSDGSAYVACASSAADGGAAPRQDGRIGRDKASPAKVGAGAAGFDFTKVCMNGTLNCTGPANTVALTPAPTDWACTKDNVTNLVWSLQVASLAWDDVADYFYQSYYADNHCGYSAGWRLPTVQELLSIVQFGAESPAIDTAFFPGTPRGNFWTSELLTVSPGAVWSVTFDNGYTLGYFKSSPLYVRLVNGGQ